MKTLSISLAMCIMLIGCPKIEQDAYNTVIAAKAFTDSVKAAHPECATGSTSVLCVDLAKAVSAKDALIDAAETYCAGPDFNGGGTCDPPAEGTSILAQATAKLQAAMAGYAQTEKDVKGVL